MQYLGDLRAGATVDFFFDTSDPTGAAVTFSGSPAVKVYKTGSTGEVSTGVTFLADADSVVGLNRVTIVTSDAFYATGLDYAVVVTAGTINAISAIGKVVGLFSIENRTPQPEGIKKNTALADFEFVMVDGVDHVSGKTGLTVTATRSIDGGAFAACANAVAEVGSGVYVIDLAAADTNGTIITFKFTATGADPAFLTCKTFA